MDRAALVRAELERQKTIARAVSEAGPPCRSCVSYRDNRCANIALIRQEFEPATGRYRETPHVPVDEARSDAGLCGPEGLLFESRSPRSLAWEETRGMIADGAAWAFAAMAVALVIFT